MPDTSRSAPEAPDSGTTRDAFLGGRLWLQQPSRGYRAGIDAVILAAACPADSGTPATVLDCGAGVGTVGLAVATRCPLSAVTLVERSPDLAPLAQANIAGNSLMTRVTLIAADVTANLTAAPGLAARAGTFDHVLANPPYFDHAHGTRATDTVKDGSNAMPANALEAWVRFAAAMAKPGGSYTLIHRAEALGEILAACDRRFGALKILPLHTRAGGPATRVVVQGIKASRAPLALLEGRHIHTPDGKSYAPEFEAILRDGAPLLV